MKRASAVRLTEDAAELVDLRESTRRAFREQAAIEGRSVASLVARCLDAIASDDRFGEFRERSVTYESG